MDFYRNVSFSGDYHQQEKVLASTTNSPCSKLLGPTTTLSPLDDLLSAQNTEVDVSMEWLSVFVEDCLSSTGNCLPPAPISTTTTTTTTKTTLLQNTTTENNPTKKPPNCEQKPSNSLEKFSIPGKARSKRKRVTTSSSVVKTRRNPLSSWCYSSSNKKTLHFPISEPTLLLHNNQQPYWLADSELIIMPKKQEQENQENQEEEDQEEEEEKSFNGGGGGGGRRCSHCLSQKTPQWRGGPLGPKTLCNACGVRYKSGRLLPEYRPAKSPTFVSYLHSNSHKKVLEMRSSSSTTTSPL